MSEKQRSLLKKLSALTKKAKTKNSKSKSTKRHQGDTAEILAYKFLIKQGLKLVEKNYSIKAGEVDLIMRDKTDPDLLIFIEVRFRKNQDFGGAAASVTHRKQQRIIKAALSYQQQHAPQSSMRFDVIAIEGDNSELSKNINWIKSAFDGF